MVGGWTGVGWLGVRLLLSSCCEFSVEWCVLGFVLWGSLSYDF